MHVRIITKCIKFLVAVDFHYLRNVFGYVFWVGDCWSQLDNWVRHRTFPSWQRRQWVNLPKAHALCISFFPRASLNLLRDSSHPIPDASVGRSQVFLEHRGIFLNLANRWKTLSAVPDFISDWQVMNEISAAGRIFHMYARVLFGKDHHVALEKYSLSRVTFIGNLSEIFYFYPRDQKLQKCTLL